jgi:phage shock protein C
MSGPLRKSRNRILGGVCGGIALWLGWDPTLVRILYVIVSVVSAAFPGILIYLVLWIIMPPPD